MTRYFDTASTTIKIGNRTIGASHPVYVIAELSANHKQDLQIALDSVQAAAEAGADAVKVQTYSASTMTLDSERPEFLAREDSLWAGRRLFDLYSEGSLPPEWHHPLQKAATKAGIDFFSSPFDIDAVDFLQGLDVPALKIASLEIVDTPLIRAAARTGKPVILSAGIASEEDIDLAVDTCLATGNNQVILLQCTTQYPTRSDAVDLSAIQWILDDKGLVPGLSDHTAGSTAAIASVALGGRVVEKHFVLDADMETLDKEFSLDPTGLKNYITAIRDIESMLGQAGYHYSTPKKSARRSARSLIATADIAQGEILSSDNVRSLRPNIGLPPRYTDKVLGAIATKSIRRGDGITQDAFSPPDQCQE